jgi:hypothetical protein
MEREPETGLLTFRGWCLMNAYPWTGHKSYESFKHYADMYQAYRDKETSK